MEAKRKEAQRVIEALQEPLAAALQETDTQPPVDNEKLHWKPFVLVIVYYFIAGMKSGRLLLTHLPHADPALGLPTDLKKSTFFEAFRRFSPTQARQLFYYLLSSLALFPVPEMATLGILCAVDGSHWPALHRMSWAVVGTNKPTVLLHLAFGLNQLIPVAMLLTESNSSERSALRQMIQAGVTYVADRGYFAYYLLHDIANAKAFFVLRVRCNLCYTIVETLKVNIPAGLTWLFDVEDLKVECGDGKDKGTWRLVRYRIGNSLFILLTNRWELTTWQIIVIYAYRWQIELFFLFAKRTLNGLHLLTHSRNGVEIQFYLLLVSTLLLLYFKQRNDAATQENTPPAEPVQVPLPSEACASGEVAAVGEATSDGNQETASPPAETDGPVDKSEQSTLEYSGENPGEAAQAPARTQPQAPATGQESSTVPKGHAKTANPKTPASPPPRQGTIVDDHNAQWYRDLGQKLRDFWRISIHWLQVLRDNLTRPWNPAVFQLKVGLYVPKQ